MKKGFALTSALAIAAAMAFTATTADAKSRKSYQHYYGGNYQPNWNTYGWNQPRVQGRRDPSSYDGVRTGQPRTCGSEFFRYDERGVPYGPYCN